MALSMKAAREDSCLDVARMTVTVELENSDTDIKLSDQSEPHLLMSPISHSFLFCLISFPFFPSSDFWHSPNLPPYVYLNLLPRSPPHSCPISPVLEEGGGAGMGSGQCFQTVGHDTLVGREINLVGHKINLKGHHQNFFFNGIE